MPYPAKYQFFGVSRRTNFAIAYLTHTSPRAEIDARLSTSAVSATSMICVIFIAIPSFQFDSRIPCGYYTTNPVPNEGAFRYN